MKTEKTIMLTGKEYRDIKEHLAHNPDYEYTTQDGHHPENIKVTEIYLDTDADFTRHPEQFARVNDNLQVQAKIVYDE